MWEERFTKKESTGKAIGTMTNQMGMSEFFTSTETFILEMPKQERKMDKEL